MPRDSRLVYDTYVTQYLRRCANKALQSMGKMLSGMPNAWWCYGFELELDTKANIIFGLLP